MSETLKLNACHHEGGKVLTHRRYVRRYLLAGQALWVTLFHSVSLSGTPSNYLSQCFPCPKYRRDNPSGFNTALSFRLLSYAVRLLGPGLLYNGSVIRKVSREVSTEIYIHDRRLKYSPAEVVIDSTVSIRTRQIPASTPMTELVIRSYIP